MNARKRRLYSQKFEASMIIITIATMLKKDEMKYWNLSVFSFLRFKRQKIHKTRNIGAVRMEIRHTKFGLKQTIV